MKELGELEETSKSQKKNENGKMIKKDVNCPQKIEMVILNQNR